MCLRRITETKRLNKNLVVWKVLQKDSKNKKYYSPFRHCEYHRNGLKMPHITIAPYDSHEPEIGIKLEQGYHSYLTRKAARESKRSTWFANVFPLIIVKCIIPKGTRIAIGMFTHYKSIASETIIFPKF